MKVGLRIDVDTFRGTQRGVPDLSRMLADKGIRGTFFFSVGPDNMGRHLWRLLRPDFLWKMLRSNAPALYGWDILLRGTLWPGPRIGERLAEVIRRAAANGHEIGFHAWDHHAWQMHIDGWDDETIRAEIGKGIAALTEILGRPPTCSASPGWRCHDRALALKEAFPFEYNSDCRGTSVFLPVLPGGERATGACQVPVTLPTYDELVGTGGVSAADYYRQLLALLDPQGLNVLAAHAEVEGMICLGDFEGFVDAARQAGWSFVPLGQLAAEEACDRRGHLEKSTVPGRSGWVARQAAS